MCTEIERTPRPKRKNISKLYLKEYTSVTVPFRWIASINLWNMSPLNFLCKVSQFIITLYHLLSPVMHRKHFRNAGICRKRRQVPHSIGDKYGMVFVSEWWLFIILRNKCNSPYTAGRYILADLNFYILRTASFSGRNSHTHARAHACQSTKLHEINSVCKLIVYHAVKFL